MPFVHKSVFLAHTAIVSPLISQLCKNAFMSVDKGEADREQRAGGTVSLLEGGHHMILSVLRSSLSLFCNKRAHKTVCLHANDAFFKVCLLFLLVATPHHFYLDLIRNSLLTAVNR